MAEIHRNVVFLGLAFEAREHLFAFCIDCHPKRAREAQRRGRAGACLPSKCVCGHGRLDRKFPSCVSALPPFLPLFDCRCRGSNYSLPSLISSSEEGRGCGSSDCCCLVSISAPFVHASCACAIKCPSPPQPPGGGWGTAFCRGAELLCITMMPKSQSTR